MKTIHLLPITFLLIFASCTQKETHFISDAQQRNDVENDLNAKMQQLPEGDLFSIFDTELTLKEREALQFLYAYMPLGDITDYPGEYYKENVDLSFKAKEEMPWGNDIPEREFNHFVLPVRTNNENLDAFRATYYDELKARVQNLSLYDAILEVNHWCHEKANYKGSDVRTSSPMATVKTSWGRCGEESTLLVAALRTVCIPARQVYTPRWAHCDDNHAWVEAWVDGKWHFLGACEPEPVLDLGWFNEPASRALLLHTRVFGRYYGPEEVIERTENHTEINVVDNYAETAKATITVKDKDGQVVPNIPVEFKIYNYAEFCTVVTKNTDENGQTWITGGLGDMMAYAAKDGKFGFQMIRFGKTDEITITLDHDINNMESFEFDIVPPVATSVLPEISEDMRAENTRRFAAEDSIRNAYIANCQAQQESLSNALKERLNVSANIAVTESEHHGSLITDLLNNSWGNYQTLSDFMNYAIDKGEQDKATALLLVISGKDLRDVSLDVLIDHLDNSSEMPKGEPSTDIAERRMHFGQYVLNPRVSNEMITPYRGKLSQYFNETEKQEFQTNPEQLVNWVRQNISIKNELNVRQIPMFPTGVLKAKAADSHSRDIFFVAMARSLGIAAQIDPVTGQVQYYDTQWHNVNFEAAESAATVKGFLNINYSISNGIQDPKYYTHFSIKKFNGSSFDLLAYDAKDPGIDDGMTLSSFDHPTPLDAGFYILTSGTRLSDGSVLQHSEFFTIKEGETTDINLVLREPNQGVSIIGNFNAENRFDNAESNENQSVLQVAGRNFYVLGILDQGSEPTTHAMQDISTFKNEFEASGLQMLFMFNNKENYDKFKLKNFNELPSNITYGINDRQMQDEIISNLHLSNANLPIFIIANSNNEVVFVSQGYTIGLGEQLLKEISNL